VHKRLEPMIPHSADLELTAWHLRRRILELIHDAGGGHTGGSLSSLDILVALHYRVLRLDPARPRWPDRDRFVLSKGHSVEGYYCILADLGFIPAETLATYGRAGSILAGHPTMKVPGVELATGALGHGLSAGVGMALAARLDAKAFRVFILLGDGELAEGSVWEAAMAASHYRLGNLTAIVDRNRLQISGDTEAVMALDDLGARWRAFGWEVEEIDGHDIELLADRLGAVKPVDRPRLFIAKTVKGRGVSFIEGDPAWHHHVPTDAELAAAISEIDSHLNARSGKPK
jgi:transketolase